MTSISEYVDAVHGLESWTAMGQAPRCRKVEIHYANQAYTVVLTDTDKPKHPELACSSPNLTVAVIGAIGRWYEIHPEQDEVPY